MGDLFILKQKQENKFKIIGCVFSYRPRSCSQEMTNGEGTKKTEEDKEEDTDSKQHDKLNDKSSKLCQLLQSESVSQFQVFVKIFLQQKDSKYLSVEVLKELLDTLVDEKEHLVVAINQSNLF